MDFATFFNESMMAVQMMPFSAFLTNAAIDLRF
jgi:hypothetical protein